MRRGDVARAAGVHFETQSLRNVDAGQVSKNRSSPVRVAPYHSWMHQPYKRFHIYANCRFGRRLGLASECEELAPQDLCPDCSERGDK